MVQKDLTQEKRHKFFKQFFMIIFGNKSWENSEKFQVCTTSGLAVIYRIEWAAGRNNPQA